MTNVWDNIRTRFKVSETLTLDTAEHHCVLMWHNREISLILKELLNKNVFQMNQEKAMLHEVETYAICCLVLPNASVHRKN